MMRIGREMSDWLADTGAPDRARNSAAAAARAIAGIPALARFRRAVAQAPTGAAGIAALDAAAASLLGDTGWCADLVDRLCAMLADDPFFVPPQPAIANGVHAALIIYDDARITVSLGTGGADALASAKGADRGQRALMLTGRRSRIRFLRGGDATLAFHVLDERGRLMPAGRRPIRDGDGFAIDGRRATWVVEGAMRDMVLLQASIKDDPAPHACTFDPATGMELARSSSDEAASRTQMLLSLLGTVDHPGSARVMQECLDDPAPFVRWHAMREWVALDATAALPRLFGMAGGDPDRGVRDAARATLALLRGEIECPA